MFVSYLVTACHDKGLKLYLVVVLPSVVNCEIYYKDVIYYTALEDLTEVPDAIPSDVNLVDVTEKRLHTTESM